VPTARAGNLIGGQWSEEERSLHINKLKLLVALFALRAFLKHVRGVSVLLKNDSVTTVAHINRLDHVCWFAYRRSCGCGVSRGE
jgi:hypothetical protein